MVHYFTTDQRQLGGSRKLQFTEKKEFQLDCR